MNALFQCRRCGEIFSNTVHSLARHKTPNAAKLVASQYISQHGQMVASHVCGETRGVLGPDIIGVADFIGLRIPSQDGHKPKRKKK